MDDPAGSESRALPPGPVKCGCVAWHRPDPTELHRHHILPLGRPWFGPDTPGNLVWLCPTSHSNVHELLRAYLQAGATPGPETLKPYGRTIRKLAARAWAEYQQPSTT